MRVLYDNQIFSSQEYGGISRYFIELFKEFNKNNKVQWQLAGGYSKNIYLKETFPEIKFLNTKSLNFRGAARILELLNRFSFRFDRQRVSKNYDLFHSTYYDPYYPRKISSKTPKVVTVYDMIHEIFRKDNKLIQQKKKSILEADMIIAISKSTAIDICEFYNVPFEKIIVTHLASSLYYDERLIDANVIIPNRYILFVGLRHWYKNFDFMLKSIRELFLEDKSLMLCCAGGPSFSKEELNLFKELGLLGRISWVRIENDAHLSMLYKKSLFFIFPSKYEGFGIPVLEAMNCDCPVVLSETSSLKEIADYAGFYFNPESSKSIFDACEQVLKSEELRKSLQVKGSRRRKDFSWRVTAEQTMKAYQRLTK